MQKLDKNIATLWFVGYSPFAPGTIASFIGLCLYLFFGAYILFYAIFTILTVVAGFWASTSAERQFRHKDPPEIVIDEFSCMLLVCLFVPLEIKLTLAAFLLFRFFDIIKPPPADKMEKLKGSYGIMLDDLVSAVYTILTVHFYLFIRQTYL